MKFAAFFAIATLLFAGCGDDDAMDASVSGDAAVADALNEDTLAREDAASGDASVDDAGSEDALSDDASTADAPTPFDSGPPETCEVPGANENVPCGLCGTVDRFCTADRVWAYGLCEGESGACTPGTVDTVACGNCGTEEARCTDACEWESIGECADEGVCAPGESSRNGDGCMAGENRDVTCTDMCMYEPAGECTSDECERPGAIEEVSCGMCGTTERFCNAARAWEYGVCQAEGLCVPGTSENVACGMCGQESRRCNVSCDWESTGACMNEGVCTPGEQERTGDGCPGAQTRLVECDATCGLTTEIEACADAPAGCSKLDLLFIIDDSGSMAEEQMNLTLRIANFVALLDATSIDYRIGVTTTSRDFLVNTSIAGMILPMPETGPNGALIENPACGMTQPWIERGVGAAGDVECLVNVGTAGGTEMPLLMAEWALTARVMDGSNSGFLRSDALLSVVILTDEDDCSRTDDEVTIDLLGGGDLCDPMELISSTQLISTLDAVKGRARWSASVIAAPMACSSALGDAAVGTRLLEFTGGAAANTSFSSICFGDLAGPLRSVFDRIERACTDYR